MNRNIVKFAAAMALTLALAMPNRATSQVMIENPVRLSLGGIGFAGSGATFLSNIVGLTYVTPNGLEFGGDLQASILSSESGTSVSGFFFGRVNYNFIGESLFVPFVTVGMGRELKDAQSDLIGNAGVGFKYYFADRASFDAQANGQWQLADGSFTYQKGVALFYGLSFYFGG
jgi:hypothetical protein